MDIIQWNGMTLEQVEKEQILAAVAFYKNKTVAAKALGTTYRNLFNKLKKYSEEDSDVSSSRKSDYQKSVDKIKSLYPPQILDYSEEDFRKNIPDLPISQYKYLTVEDEKEFASLEKKETVKTQVIHNSKK
jgi:hypothetical protein